MRYLSIISISLLLLASPWSCLKAQDEIPSYTMKEELVVTASRVPTAFSDVSRSVVLIDRDDIEKAPVSSIQELLEYAAGIDLRQQGAGGIRADLFIRGASFEQTLVLLDGVKLIDPQTGHHNLDLPISLADVERIEVLKGQGSSIYGPNAFGGIINIITRKSSVHSVRLSAGYGEDNTRDGSISIFSGTDRSFHRISLSGRFSDGYRESTEYDDRSASYFGRYGPKETEIDLTTGYNRRKFGANGFYGSSSTRQWEETETTYLKTGLSVRRGDILVNPRLFYRHHKDHYIWDRDNPELYENFHTTEVYGGELQIDIDSPAGHFILGGEYSADLIRSNKLGNHDRSRTGLFIEHLPPAGDRFDVSLGLSAHHYDGMGWKAWPGIDAGYRLGSSGKLFASAGSAFRLPTYTELYYNDPEHEGNPDLLPEKSWNFETGISRTGRHMSASVSWFFRDSDSIIDWVKSGSDEIWLSKNVTSTETSGIECRFNWRDISPFPMFVIDDIDLSYTWIDSSADLEGVVSSYAINHLKNHIILRIRYEMPKIGISQGWVFGYEDRCGFRERFLVDLRTGWRTGEYHIYLDLMNITDNTDGDYLFVPSPGRRIMTGLAIRF